MFFSFALLPFVIDNSITTRQTIKKRVNAEIFVTEKKIYILFIKAKQMVNILYYCTLGKADYLPLM